jgi:hypothetical protein
MKWTVRERVTALVDITSAEDHLPERDSSSMHGHPLSHAGGPQPGDPDGPPAEDGRPAVTLGVETSWVAGPDGSRRLLGHAQRRIVTALADLHRRAPGATLTIRELVEVGWPGERPLAGAGANRVHVALTQLRRMGMRDILERCGGGYRFAPNATVKLSA